MFIFVLFTILATIATAVDIITTVQALRVGDVEANTFLYGSKPSLMRMAAIGAAFLIAFFAVGLIALHYGAVFESVIALAVLTVVRGVAALSNIALIMAKA